MVRHVIPQPKVALKINEGGIFRGRVYNSIRTLEELNRINYLTVLQTRKNLIIDLDNF